MKKEKEKKGKNIARAKTQYTFYTVKEPVELMDFLLKSLDGISRNSVKSLLTNRRVLVNNTIQTLYNFELKPGMKVSISKNKNNKEFKSPYLSLLYEDAYLLIIDKKVGIPAIGFKNKNERSAYTILRDYVQRYSKTQRLFPVYKLEKDASGILIFAKDEKTKNNFLDYWHEIIRKRRFVAVVRGEMEKDSGQIASWMGDDKLYISSIEPKLNKNDKVITHYEVIKKRNDFSLLEITTGDSTKNQIKLHLDYLGHPIVGDEKFDKKENILKRLALHIFKLEFNHPVTGEILKFETPYPSSFKSLLIKSNPEKENSTGKD